MRPQFDDPALNCFICGELAKWEVKLNNVLQFGDDAFYQQVCSEHMQSIALRFPPYIRQIEGAIPLTEVMSLTEAYKIWESDYKFARCPGCRCVFVDDVMLFGSLRCPTPGCKTVALERGLQTPDG
jgi:hypothetical protein